MKIILLLAGSLPDLTSARYLTMARILPSSPCKACTLSKILLDNEFNEIYLIYLSKCSTPISSGSVASTLHSIWKNDLVIDPVFALTSYFVMKA